MGGVIRHRAGGPGGSFRHTLRAILAAWLLLCGAPAIAQTVTTYSNTTTGTINGSTTCTAPLVRNFTVGTSFTVADVDLGMLATHTWRGDIRLTLQSPAGTRVQLVNGDSASVSGDNFNVRLNDEGGSVVNTDGNTVDHITTAPPYQNDFRPNSTLTAFDGQNAQGTWQLEICDIYPSADNGSFTRADLYLTSLPANYADLSLAKTVSNAAPAIGATITYTLTLNNSAASNQTATNVTVRDQLPAGATFVSASGYGTYVSGTGIWTVPSITPNQSRTLTIAATVSASAGATVVNSTEVQSSNRVDPDSTPGNGATNEDDYAQASFTVAGTPGAGTPPAFTCPVGNTVLDWDAITWNAGSLSNSYPLANIGNVGFTITAPPGIWLNDANFGGQTPAKSTYYNAGLYAGQQALHYLIDSVTQADQVTTVIMLQNGAAGARFIVSDIDDGGAQFKDRLVVTGSYQGSPVSPILTNNIANAVSGNVAIGIAAAANNVQDGNIIVTFLSPVDTITVVYGPDGSGPTAPGQQGIGIHDMTFCNPLANIQVSKSSIVYDSGAGEIFHVPGNDMLYTINVANTASGPVTVDSLFVRDTLPANLTFFNGDANGPGPGTAPVIYANSGSGLSFSVATDVRYSNAATPPANFAACNYVPVAGYDPNIRHICINPKGTMAGKSGATTPSFSLSFRARIE